MSAINKRCKVEFSLNVYNIKKELTPYTECKISPHYVTMGNGRYYLIGTYDGSEKIYLFRVDLMTKIEITTEKSVRRESISELRDMNLSEYMYQHPYMISGEVRRMKLRVNKDIFTQIIDWFGIDVVVLLDTETENTIDVIIKACERAMHYWLLQYGEGVQALEMNDVFARRMQMAAKAIYEKYGKL
jgi:predicted DNA-binding transcriptional regulator YafY